MQNIEQHQTKRNTTIIIVDGFEMRKKSTTSRGDQYVCTDKLNLKCKASGYFENGVLVMKKNHCHLADEQLSNRERFKDALWNQITSTEDEPRAIWERVALQFPEAAAVVTYPSIERQMGKWRQDCRPPVPKDLKKFADIINSEKWSKYRKYGNEQHLTIHTIVLNRDVSVTIISDPNFLSSLQHINDLYVDATFEICPRKMNISQFLTIMGKIENNATPLAWAFMTSKTEMAYRAVFNYFRYTLAPHIRPEVVHVDFEAAIRNALRSIYPTVKIVFCYFHHCQALWKRIKARGKIFIQKLTTWHLALAFYRKLMGLALLPPANIYAAFNFLIENTAQDVLHFFGDTFIYQYYQGYWLDQVTPEGFSVYGERDRTTNPIEAYHRIMRHRIGSHPGVWQFMAKLRDYQTIVRIETHSLDTGCPIRRTTAQKYVDREIVLSHMWDLYDEGTMSVARFLSCYNHVSESFFNDYIINKPSQVDDFLTLSIHNTAIQLPQIDGTITIEGIAKDVIPISIRDTKEETFTILILEDINLSLCHICKMSVLNLITLPCRHWYLCETCTSAHIEEAEKNKKKLYCQKCGQQCIAFESVQIS